jgi:hypothetical protein
VVQLEDPVVDVGVVELQVLDDVTQNVRHGELKRALKTHTKNARENATLFSNFSRNFCHSRTMLKN